MIAICIPCPPSGVRSLLSLRDGSSDAEEFSGLRVVVCGQALQSAGRFAPIITRHVPRSRQEHRKQSHVYTKNHDGMKPIEWAGQDGQEAT